DTHHQDKDTEALAQQCFRDASSQAGSEQRAKYRCDSDRTHQGPVQFDGGEVAGQASKRLHGDNHQGGAYGHRHGQPTQQSQRGDDEEPTTRAHQTGDHTDDQTVEDHPAQGQITVFDLTGGALAATDHCDGGGDHHQRERDHQHHAGDVPAEQSAAESTRHAGGAEDYAGAPLYPAVARVVDRADRRSHTDDEQGGGDGFLRVESSNIGQDGHGEDRSAAAEQAERQADQDRQQQGEDKREGHGVS